MKSSVSKLIKCVCAVFCGLATLAGIINTISPSPSDSRTENLVLTVIFLVFTILLIRSIYKESSAQRDVGVLTSANNRPGEKGSTPRSGQGKMHPDAPTLDSPVLPVSVHKQHTEQKAPAANRDVLAGPFKHIPQEVFQLLWFANGPFQNYFKAPEATIFDFMGFSVQIGGTNVGEEPSAIDIELPLSSIPAVPTPLNYYPSYGALSPQQRTAYLMWLVDITAPIDIGYVFIFYYGLERHLFFGNSEAALAAILVLRSFHFNSSFQTYSGDAILLYALTYKRPEILQHLDLQQVSLDLRLFASAISQHCLTAQDIMAAHKKFSFENTRYIKAEPALFVSTLEDMLLEKTGKRELEISLDDFRSAKGTFTLALANYSLLPAQRFLSLPDISTAPVIHDRIYALLVGTHESVKVKLRELRKQSKSR